MAYVVRNELCWCEWDVTNLFQAEFHVWLRVPAHPAFDVLKSCYGCPVLDPVPDLTINHLHDVVEEIEEILVPDPKYLNVISVIVFRKHRTEFIHFEVAVTSASAVRESL